MPTNWTDFVKSFAKAKNISYGCALSDPDCSAGYRKKYGNKKPLGKNKETELMGMEDIDAQPSKKSIEFKKAKASMKQKLNKSQVQRQLLETTGMMAEDINKPKEAVPTNITMTIEEVVQPVLLEKELTEKGGRRGAKPPTPKGRGRPKKYATAEEARKAKIANTIAGAKRRKEKKNEPVILFAKAGGRRGTAVPYLEEGQGLFSAFNQIGKIAKKVFKRTNPIQSAVVSAVSNIVRNPKAVISGRDDFPPKVRKIISKYGNKNITGITLARTPLGTPLMTALQIASGNTFSQKLSNTPYDKLFHLFVCIDFEDGSKITLEKNEVINSEEGCKLPKDTETKSTTSSDIPTALTLNDALEKTRERMGKNFFTYSAKDNNCQDFIIAFLKANNIGNETDTSWVKQETKVLFEGNDRLRKIANTLTDIGSRVNVITEGAGIFNDFVSGLNKINPVMLGIKKNPKVGIKLGKVTNNTLLPAVVEVGKPIYDATAIATATTLTGNPLLGKVVADEFWNKYGKPYDPRSRQDNSAIKLISKEIGKSAGSKVGTGAGSSIQRDRRERGERGRERLGEILDTSQIMRRQLEALLTKLDEEYEREQMGKEDINRGKGLVKKSSNSIKMANKWITYVKDYAKKNNMKYNDALKHPDVKAGYKSGKGVGGVHEMPDGTMMLDSDMEKPVFTTMPIKPFRPKIGMGMPSSRDEYISQLYDQANLGANGRVNLK